MKDKYFSAIMDGIVTMIFHDRKIAAKFASSTI